MPRAVLSALDAFTHFYPQQFFISPISQMACPSWQNELSGRSRTQTQAGWLWSLSSSPLHCTAFQCFRLFTAGLQTFFPAGQSLSLPTPLLPNWLFTWSLGAASMITPGSTGIALLKPEATAGRELSLPHPPFPFFLLPHSSSIRCLLSSALGRSQRVFLFLPSLVFLTYLAAGSSLPNLL